MNYLVISFVIGGIFVLAINQHQKRQHQNKIAELQSKNRILLGENYDLKSEKAALKVFINTIKDRVQLLEEKDFQKDTWFSDLIRHNPEQPFSKENIERLLKKNKFKDFDT